MIPEESIQSAIADWLDLNPLKMAYQWFHVPSGGHMVQIVKTRKGWQRVSHLGRRRKRIGAKRGVPDIIVVFAGGSCLQMEVKSPSGRLSKHQRKWLDRAEELDNPCFVVRSVEDVQRIFKLRKFQRDTWERSQKIFPCVSNRDEVDST